MGRRISHHLAALCFAAVPTLALAGAHKSDAQYNCSVSTGASLSSQCRPETLRKIDEQILLPLQSIVKVDQDRYDGDLAYRNWIDRSFDMLSARLALGTEIVDPRSMFLAQNVPLDPDMPETLPKSLDAFPTQYAGCNFTRERLGDLQLSRSFLLAFKKDGVQKFGAVHVQIGAPERVHEQSPSKRTPDILAIEFYPLVPGFPNSNELLRTHILPDPSARCMRIVDLMDQAIIDELRLQ